MFPQLQANPQFLASSPHYAYPHLLPCQPPYIHIKFQTCHSGAFIASTLQAITESDLSMMFSALLGNAHFVLFADIYMSHCVKDNTVMLIHSIIKKCLITIVFNEYLPRKGSYGNQSCQTQGHRNAGHLPTQTTNATTQLKATI